MTLEIFLILFAVGIAAGILSGMFGVGGGVIIVPSLVSVYSFVHFQSEYSVHIAIATSLFTIIFTSISSSYKHFKKGNVVISAAVIIGLTSAIAVFLFSKVAISLPGDVLKKIFSVIVIVVALKMLFSRNKEEGDSYADNVKNFNRFLTGVIGILTGMLAAFAGLGGGGFAIPLMHYVLKFPFRKSIGTSTLAIMITSVAGVISYFINMPANIHFAPYSFGMVDTVSALPIIAASIPFANVGVRIHHKIQSFMLTKLFAIFLLCISIKLIFF